MKYLLIVLGVGVIAFGVFLLASSDILEFTKEPKEEDPVLEEEEEQKEPIEEEEAEEEENLSREVIGESVEGRDIVAYHYGDGDDDILFIGGIHGGYSWGTSLLSYEIMEYLEDNPEIVPDNVRVTIIPVLNPDGLSTVVKKEGRFTPSDVIGDTVVGRFNANQVDLNRNFDCNWETSGLWMNNVVNAGDEVFSEPESKSLRDYVENKNPKAVIVYFGAAGGVYSSGCNGDVLPETVSLMNSYASASGYTAEGYFDSYKITGDLADWLSKKEVPAISVLLSNHDSTDWTQNRKGLEAVLLMYDN